MQEKLLLPQTKTIISYEETTTPRTHKDLVEAKKSLNKKLTSKKASKPKKKNPKNKRKYKTPKSATFTSSTYKTVICEFFKKGACKKGEDCSFSHNWKMKVLDEICRYHLTGNCMKETCLFSHDVSQYPCKYYFLGGMCKNMLNCEFSHEDFKDKDTLIKYIKEHSDNIYIQWKRGFRTPLLVYAIEGGYVEKIREGEQDTFMLIPGIGDEEEVSEEIHEEENQEEIWDVEKPAIEIYMP